MAGAAAKRPAPGGETAATPAAARAVAPICLLVYVVLALLVFLPAGPLATSTLPIAGVGNPAYQDPFQMAWFLSYLPYALTHGAPLFHTRLIDYPVGVNLADNTSVPLLGLIGWPITATLGPIATFNFLIRLAFALSAASMFLVARRWCSSWQGPFLAGLLYAFGPYMMSQELHLDLAFVPIPPLLVLLGDELVRRRRVQPLLLGGLIGLAAGLQFLISPDVLSGCVLLSALIGAALLRHGRRELASFLPYLARAAASVLVVFALVCGYPIYEMLIGPGHLTGPVIETSFLQHNSADILGPIAPTSYQLLVPNAVAHLGDYLVGGNISENGTYIGIPLLVFLVISYRRLRRQRRDGLVAVCAAGAITAFVLSLGGHLVVATSRTWVLLPGYLLSKIPLFDNTIPARYALYVAAFVSIIVAVAVDRVWLPAFRVGFKRAARQPGAAGAGPASPPEPAPPRRGHARGRLAGGAALIVLSLLPTVPFVSASLPWASSLPARLMELATAASQHRKTLAFTSDPIASPSDARPMTWEALDGLSFSITGGYANVDVPGQSYGQRTPWPTPPPVLEGAPEPPISGETAGFAHPGSERANLLFTEAEETQLCSYLSAYGIDAVVGASEEQEQPPGSGTPISASLPVAGQSLPPGDDSGATTRFLDGALGPPRYTGPGWAIWITPDRCRARDG